MANSIKQFAEAAAIPAFQHGERRSITQRETVEYLDAWSYREWLDLLGFPAVGPAIQYNSPPAVGKKNRCGKF